MVPPFLLEGNLTFIPQPIIWDENSKTNAGILAYYHMKICISLWLFDWTEFLRSFYYLYKKLWCYLIFFYVEGWHLNICRKASAFYFMTTKKELCSYYVMAHALSSSICRQIDLYVITLHSSEWLLFNVKWHCVSVTEFYYL